MVFDFLDNLISYDWDFDFFTDDTEYATESNDVFDDTASLGQDLFYPFIKNEYSNASYSTALQDFYDVTNVSENNLDSDFQSNDFFSHNDYGASVSAYEAGNADSRISAFIHEIENNSNDFKAQIEHVPYSSDRFMDMAIDDEDAYFMREHISALETVNTKDKELIFETEKSLREVSAFNDVKGQNIGIYPVVNISFGDVRETADVNAISEHIRDMIVRELLASCEGVY